MLHGSLDIKGTGANELSPVSLVIPARPEYIGLCRLVAGVVGSRKALDEESIADLKLVVTEACTLFLYGLSGRQAEQAGLDASPCSMRVEFGVTPQVWEITISDPEGRHRLAGLGGVAPTSEGGLGLMIINALADTVEHIETEATGSVIRLVKRFPSSVIVDS
jgi:anti-sigma regulatory factor (Ser/Thr protein kinase)